MRYRVLGRTGLRVSEIGLGTSQTFRLAAKDDEDRCVRIVHEALDRGINFFDTAPNYWDAERVLGRALEGRRKEALIATKVRAEDEAAARESIERSFDRLRTGVIDLLQIHSMKGWREVTPLIEGYRRRGKVRFIGLTESNPEDYGEVLDAMRTGAYDTIQVMYSAAERSCCERLLPLAREMGIGVIALRAILNLLAERIPLDPAASPPAASAEAARARGKTREAMERGMSPLLASCGAMTPGQALLRYVLAHPAVSTIIVATGKVERIAENAAASDGGPLPAEARKRLEDLLA